MLRHKISVTKMCNGAGVTRTQVRAIFRGGTPRTDTSRAIIEWSWKQAPNDGLRLVDLTPDPDRQLAALEPNQIWSEWAK